MPWRIDALIDQAPVRAAAGEWLLPARREMEEPAEIPWSDGPFARGRYDAALAGDPNGLQRLSSADVLQLDFDLLNGDLADLREVLKAAIPAASAEAIVNVAESPPRENVQPQVRALKNLTPRDEPEIPWVDLVVPTVIPGANWQCAVRTCLAFVGERWLVTLWTPFVTPEQVFGAPTPRWKQYEEIGKTLSELGPPLVPGEEASGDQLLMRFARYLIRQAEWALIRCQKGLVRWETAFLSDHASVARIERHTVELAHLGQCVACVHYGALGLQERVGLQPIFDINERKGYANWAAEVRQGAREARSELRECFALASEAASTAQASLAERRAVQTRRFEFAAGLVTAFVLVPGLVVGFYGANVGGLPGQDKTEGLFFMALGAALSGALTIFLLTRFIRHSDETAAAEEDDSSDADQAGS